MKKIISVVITAIFMFSLCACGASDIMGVYSNISLEPISMANLEKSSDAALTISKDGDSFSYIGEQYKGIGKLEENILTLTPEEGVNERNTALLDLEIKKGESIDEEYIVYKNYLIKNIPLDYDEQDGEIPTEKNNTDCFFNVADSLGSYFIEFYKDGTCEIEYEYEIVGAFSSSGEYYYEGTYTVDGQIILITLTHCEYNLYETGERVSDGQYTCALYVDKDGEIYDTVYKK